MAVNEQTPFENPTIPFIGAIHGGLVELMTISINGRVLPDCNKFHVNLQSGTEPNANIALHINPRYGGAPYVVVNTLHDDKWGKEDRKSNSPFLEGSDFNLAITITSQSYKLTVNGDHFDEFAHRFPFDQVDTIKVGGDVEIFNIAFFHAPVIPYKNTIHGEFKKGRIVTIQGMVKPDATWFNVNLRSPSGIALHYNTRFNQNAVVRNTFQSGGWGSEELDGVMPFQRGEPFLLTIKCETDFFNIMVNGMPVHIFKYRLMPLTDINILEIDGDITLTSVAM